MDFLFRMYLVFDFKIDVISKTLEKQISFSLDNKLSFIDGFQLFSSSLDSLMKIILVFESRI